MDIRKLGLDPGFGGIKVAEVVGSKIRGYMLPSVVGIGTTETGALNLAGVVRGGRRRQPHQVAFDGIEYLVGDGVANHARPIERMDFARFADSPELRALLYAALHQIVDGGSHQVSLAIGLPIEILLDKSLAATTEREMSRWLLGQHQFSLDGVEARLKVVNLKAKIAQPLATWFDWGLGLDGKWIKGAKAAKSPVLIIDLGFNTLDLLVVEGGRISTRYTGGDTLGMRRAAEIVADNIQRRYGVDLSLHEIDALVQEVVAGKRVTIYVGGEDTEVTPLVRQALNTLGANVVRFVESRVGKAGKFRIFITAGGALALGRRLLAQYPRAVVVDDPVMANGRGLAKLAARAGFL